MKTDNLVRSLWGNPTPWLSIVNIVERMQQKKKTLKKLRFHLTGLSKLVIKEIGRRTRSIAIKVTYFIIFGIEL